MKTIADKEEFYKTIKDSEIVVVDFYADWCGPCRQIAPKVEEMAVNYPNVLFVKVDVDNSSEIAEEQQISAMPTFKIFKNGDQVGEFTGANASKLEEEIKKAIES